MYLVLGNMNGEWFPNGSHMDEYQARKMAIKLTEETGHIHIVVKEEERK